MLDLVPVAIGSIGLLAAALDAGGNPAVAFVRTFVGAAFIGAITDAMLLGHWYLVQPGLPRRLLNEMVTALQVLWPLELIAMLLPVGMLAVLTGEVDDGWGGLLGWMWLGCTAMTIVLIYRHQGRPQGAVLLGGDGGHRPALPRHPHRLRHGHHRPRRPRPRLTRP